MVMTDPISDLITRIRNGYRARKEAIELPGSKVKTEIVRVLKAEGFVSDYEIKADKFPVLRVYLLYRQGKKAAVEGIRRVSKPGGRRYVGQDEIPRVMNGLGIAVISTSKGVFSDQEARNLKLGGELLLEVW
ncbi:MAG: 30S ribosomal protein S8 [bacterium]|nr:30S ribosomal protein S8 [bacterium]